VSLKFSRIQFTPDLMPMDITGTDILQETADGRREFHFVPGPVFANIVLADEINRAPPKTQAAMLEAMQEHKVTVVGKTSHLDPPFFVLATQNPVEQEAPIRCPRLSSTASCSSSNSITRTRRRRSRSRGRRRATLRQRLGR